MSELFHEKDVDVCLRIELDFSMCYRSDLAACVVCVFVCLFI